MAPSLDFYIQNPRVTHTVGKDVAVSHVLWCKLDGPEKDHERCATVPLNSLLI